MSMIFQGVWESCYTAFITMFLLVAHTNDSALGGIDQETLTRESPIVTPSSKFRKILNTTAVGGII